MRISAVYLIALTTMSAVLSGCGVELLATTAIRGELDSQAARHAATQLNVVKEKTAVLSVEQAVRAYAAEHGAYPSSLDALVPTYLTALPDNIGYNPVTGVVTTGTTVAQDDARTMTMIRQAINQYGTATGYYPPTLDDLYPQYLTQPPRTVAGEPFIYNNQNGYLAHPNPALQSAPAAASATGAGPLGEVMTGVGIQQELGRMSAGGSSVAQHRSRDGVEGISEQHTNIQNRVMDDLGL